MSGEGVELDLDDRKEDLFILFERKLIYLMKLLKLKAFGGSNEFTIQQVDVRIANILPDLNHLIDIGGIYSFSPFK